MFTNLNPGALGIHTLDLSQTIELATRFGFEGVDLPVLEVASMTEPTRAVEMVSDAGLQWGGFGLPTEFRKDDATFEKDLAELPRLVSLIAGLGCERCVTWIMPCSDERTYEQNFEFHVARLTPIARILDDHGIHFGIEFVGPKTLRAAKKYEFAHNIDQILQLADAVSPERQKVGVLLDSFHWYTSHASTDDIIGKLRHRVVYVHVNDAIAGRGPDEQIDQQRALPTDTGVIHLKAFVQSLKRINYDGPVTVEPFMPELGKLPPEQAIERTAGALKKMMSLG